MRSAVGISTNTRREEEEEEEEEEDDDDEARGEWCRAHMHTTRLTSAACLLAICSKACWLTHFCGRLPPGLPLARGFVAAFFLFA
jgi:hypothetical protein